ncbi:2-C-methyl-D-erythritol 4-phosphate cytidylyltransferase [Trueperella bialowiezensis]|nr:2-C-methyl-D-erythritol 4-phosphate cytidylyltransferase [Trueperella bialowiezensis]
MVSKRQPTFSAIVAGAGAGTRLGANKPKALVELGGVPLIVHAVRGVRAAGIDDVVVTIPPDAAAREEFEAALSGEGVLSGEPALESESAVSGKSAVSGVRLVPGGATRQESVANGLAAVDTDFVLIHDAARALTPIAVIERVMAALREGYDAVVPALPVTDTIKTVDGGSPERVVATLDRENLRAMQTPQGFRVDVLRQAHRAGEARGATEAAAPDDAALVEAMGGQVVLVEGAAEAMKVTTAWDLAVAEMLLAGRRQ